MNWLDKLEKKFGHLAIKGLITYIIGLNAFIYLLQWMDPGIIGKLTLVPSLVMKGEVWRLITYIFIPPRVSPLWIFFALYVAYMIGNSLEHEWGSFKFNVYYFFGMIGTTIAVFIIDGGATATYLNLSLFLAFAHIFPNHQFLLFFVLPVKVKYLGWLNWIYIGFNILVLPLEYKLIPLITVINFFIFFGKDLFRRAKINRAVHYNRRRFQAHVPKDFTLHKCTVCGITEKDDPKMDFRYCMDCEGEHEYCMEHLKTHEHIRKGVNENGQEKASD